MALGQIDEANEALTRAIALDPNDATNSKDRDTMNTLIHQLQMLERFTADDSDQDYDRAVTYCSNILATCPASVRHNTLKCEYLLRAFQLKEAVKFSGELMQNPDMKDVPLIKCWHGRILIYNGAEV